MSQARADITRVVERAFRQLDKNRDDVICRDELQILLERIFGRHVPTSYLDVIMSHGDRNGTGTIDSVDELIDAFNSVKAIIICCRLIEVLDVDKDGYLTKDELDSKLRSCEYPEVVSLISSAPLGANDDISCEDFFGHCLKRLMDGISS